MTCSTCARGWNRSNPMLIGCGAAFEENPIWAERKYNEDRIMRAIMGDPEAFAETGMDAENMRFSDGENCKAYKERKP